MTDAEGADSLPAVITVNVSGENDTPTIKVKEADSNELLSVNPEIDEDTPTALHEMMNINLSDRDGHGDMEVTLSVEHGILSIDLGSLNASRFDVVFNDDSDSVTITASKGNLNNLFDGDNGSSVTYTPDADYNGTDPLTVSVSDLGDRGFDEQTSSTTVSIDVVPVNDAPVANVDQFESGAMAGTLVTHLYDKNGNDLLEGIDDLLYTTNDHQYFDHKSMGYTGYNYMGSSQDNETNNPQNNNWFENHGISLSDLRGGIIEFEDGSQGRIDTASNGIVRDRLDADGEKGQDGVDDYFESSYIYYKVYDGLDSDPMTVDENGNTISIDVLANDTDVDSSGLIINSIVSVPGKGIATTDGNTISFNPNDEFNYLAEGETEEVIIKYTITDGDLVSNESQVVIVVTGTDDIPTASISGKVQSDINGIDMTDMDFSKGFRFEADVKLDGVSETFFRQENNASTSFLIEFGGKDFSSSAGNYLQVNIPVEGNNKYYTFSVKEPIAYDTWTNIEIGYSHTTGASVIIDGIILETTDIKTYNGNKDVQEMMDSVIDDNYTIGSTTSEYFNGEFKDVRITAVDDSGNEETLLPLEQTLSVYDVDGGTIDLDELMTLVTNNDSLDQVNKIELSGKTELNINIADVIEMTDSDNELLIISADDVNDAVHLDDSFNKADGTLNSTNNGDGTHTYTGVDGLDTVLLTIEDTILVD